MPARRDRLLAPRLGAALPWLAGLYGAAARCVHDAHLTPGAGGARQTADSGVAGLED